MYELLQGQELTEALAIEGAFHEMISSRGTIEPDEEVLGDAVAFAGVSKYPARVKCALLAWMAFKDAVVQTQSASSLFSSHDAPNGEEATT